MLVCGAVFLTGGAYLLLKQPLYQSTASLVLHFDTQAVPNIDRTMNPTQPLGSNEHREILYSDSEIMRSTGVIHGLITAMGIARLYPHIAASQVSDIRKLDLATESLLANLVVDVGLQSDVLNINYFNPDPTVARDTVQGLLNKFFDQEAAVYANPQITFAENEAAAARDKLTAAQNNLAQFKSQNKIADLQQQVSQFLLSRTDVESRLRVAQGRVLEAENRQKALKELLDTVPANSTSSAMGEQYHAADSAESQLDQLRAKRSQLASSYRAGSEVFQQLDAQIASLSSAARSRAGEARGRSATQPNLVYQSIKTDYLRAAAEASSAHQPSGCADAAAGADQCASHRSRDAAEPVRRSHQGGADPERHLQDAGDPLRDRPRRGQSQCAEDIGRRRDCSAHGGPAAGPATTQAGGAGNVACRPGPRLRQRPRRRRLRRSFPYPA